MNINKSLAKAAYFADVDPDPDNRASKAFVTLQERGEVYFAEHFSDLSETELARLETLKIGWSRASQQVISWLDELVTSASYGGGWAWFMDCEYMGGDGHTAIDDMLRSVRKSLRKYQLFGTVKRHSKYKTKPEWRSYTERIELAQNDEPQWWADQWLDYLRIADESDKRRHSEKHTYTVQRLPYESCSKKIMRSIGITLGLCIKSRD